MENTAQTGRPKARSPRLLWLRFPLLAALLVNLFLVLRVPVQQFAPGGQSLEQLAWAAIGGSKTDPQPPSGARPGGTHQHGPIAPNPATSASGVIAGHDHGAINIEPVVCSLMAGLGGHMAQATAAQQRHTDEFVEQFVLAISNSSPDKPATTAPPVVAIAPPAVTTAPPQIAVAPPQTTPPRSTTPAHGNPNDDPPAPPQTTRPAPPPVRTTAPTEIVLENSPKSTVVFHFVLDNRVVSLNPGEQHRITSEGPHAVRFHRGASFGYGEQVLQSGKYEFRVGDEGWEIVQTERERIKTY